MLTFVHTHVHVHVHVQCGMYVNVISNFLWAPAYLEGEGLGGRPRRKLLHYSVSSYAHILHITHIHVSVAGAIIYTCIIRSR